MNSYIICLTRPNQDPAFEVAFCADEQEAHDWAAALIRLLPGSALAAVLGPPVQS